MSEQLPELMDCRAIQRETGISRAAAEALMRSLPKVTVPDCGRSTSGEWMSWRCSRRRGLTPTEARRILDMPVALACTEGAGIIGYVQAAPRGVRPCKGSPTSRGLTKGVRHESVDQEASGQVRPELPGLYRRGGRAYRIECAGTFAARKIADRRCEAVQGWLAAGLDPVVELARLRNPPAVMTFESAAAAWAASLVDVTESSRSAYGHGAAYWSRLFSGRAPRLLTADDIQAVLAVPGVSPATLRAYRVALRGILDHVGVDPNPARSARLRWPKVDAEQVNPMEAAEVVAIFERVSKRLRLPLVVAEQCGPRVGELEQLTWADVDEQGGQFVGFGVERTNSKAAAVGAGACLAYGRGCRDMSTRGSDAVSARVRRLQRSDRAECDGAGVQVGRDRPLLAPRPTASSGVAAGSSTAWTWCRSHRGRDTRRRSALMSTGMCWSAARFPSLRCSSFWALAVMTR